MTKCLMYSTSDTLYYDAVCDQAYPSTVPLKYTFEIDSIAQLVAKETKFMAFQMGESETGIVARPSRFCIMNACFNKCNSKDIQKRAEIQYRNYKKHEKELWSIGRLSK